MHSDPDDAPRQAALATSTAALARLFESALEAEPPEHPGKVIGPYKLLEEIGEGGFGVVWMAEQTQPIRRRVALKIIKTGMDTREVIARFEAERQALAMMDHPNIARVLDAGATDAGRPYFAMELVRGIAITRYCNEHRLTTKERLRLFIAVCQAVQHAHQKGVIHRDLKPSNILVTLHDGNPVPKVIDFGIAKATGERLTEKTLFTRFHAFIGTPVYTSPEQMEMSGFDVDTRSDIYSLGVLLYELLAGRPPFDAASLLKSGWDALRQTVLHADPPSLSRCLRNLRAEDLTTVAKERGTDPARLSMQLRGDLDWIVMRCIERDRNRRYETANGLARDIERHIASEPVSARPPSTAYRLRKFVRRHKAAAAATVAVAAALVAGLVVSFALLVREREASAAAQAAQARAQIEAKRSAEVARFMKEMLAGVGPQVALGRDTQLLRVILDQTAQRVQRDLANQPELYADLLETLGMAYGEIGEHLTAEKLLHDALTVQERLHGRESLTVARLLHELALTLEGRGKMYEVEPPLREAQAIRQKLLGGRHADTAAVLADLGRIQGHWWNVAEAVVHLEEALAIQRESLGPESASVARTLTALGRVLSSGVAGRAPEGARLLHEALEINKRVSGPHAPETVECEHQIALNLYHQKRFREAEDACTAVIGHAKAVLGDVHTLRSTYLRTLTFILIARDDLAAAESAAREALGLAEQSNAAIEIELLADLVWVLARLDRAGEAEALLRESIERTRKTHPAESLNLGQKLGILSGFLYRSGRYRDAEGPARESLALTHVPEGKGWLTESARRHVGDICLELGRFAEAEALFLETHAGLAEVGARYPLRAKFFERLNYLSLIKLYTRWELPEKAAIWEARFDALKQEYSDRGRQDWAQIMQAMLDRMRAETASQTTASDAGRSLQEAGR